MQITDPLWIPSPQRLRNSTTRLSRISAQVKNTLRSRHVRFHLSLCLEIRTRSPKLNSFLVIFVSWKPPSEQNLFIFKSLYTHFSIHKPLPLNHFHNFSISYYLTLPKYTFLLKAHTLLYIQEPLHTLCPVPLDTLMIIK